MFSDKMQLAQALLFCDSALVDLFFHQHFAGTERHCRALCGNATNAASSDWAARWALLGNAVEFGPARTSATR